MQGLYRVSYAIWTLSEMGRKHFLSDLIAFFFFLTICYKYAFNSKMEEASFTSFINVLINKYPLKST